MKILEKCRTGAATMIWSSRSSQGYNWVSIGEGRRKMVDFEGIALVKMLPKDSPAKNKR